MKEAQVILNRLLDKFENSKHLSEPNTSRRRVMLRIDKRELPEYQYEDAVVRDAYNIAAREPVSYTHLDVYKRQERHSYCNRNMAGQQ